MISSEPTLDSHDSFKKDLPDHLLSRIIPLFGFEYQPVTEPCIYSHISKSKSPKGISLISKHPFNKKQLNLQNCNYINKWDQIVGDKAKINNKLFKKILNRYS